MDWQYIGYVGQIVFTAVMGLLVWSLNRNVRTQDEKIKVLEDDMKDIKLNTMARFDEIKNILNNRTNEIKELITNEIKTNTERIHSSEKCIIELKGRLNHIDVMLNNFLDYMKKYKHKT